MAVSRSRVRVADGIGLLSVVLVLLDYLRPSLLLLPTIAAGGDTPCHYPTFVWLYERLLPSLRLHGWYPGAYLGQPLLLYYFPLPFLLMSALAPLAGMPVAFKLGTVGGVFLLPLLTYVSFRLMGFRFPGPLLGAASALVFLFLEDNPIWGGTLASTLTGEFSYTYGIGLAVLFLGLVYRTYARGGRPWAPAALLGLTALAHGYAVLWAGISASFFLYGARRPLRTLCWLAAVALLAFAFAGFSILPLLQGWWGWTTPYDDPWITVTADGLVPSLLWPLFALAVLWAGLSASLFLYGWCRPFRKLRWFAAVAGLARGMGGDDRRLLFLGHAVLVGAALAAAGPALGIIDVRFVPFAQLAACLVGAATLGRLLEGLAAADLAALAVVALAIVYGDGRSRVLRYWIDWNYTGLEAKELWPAYRALADRLQGTVSDPRVAVEYSTVHERAGSIRMYETIPYFSGRSTLEGVYNQASLQTHAVYYLASALGATSPNPFRSREYSLFNPEAALVRLRLFNVRDVVALSEQLTAALEARADVGPVARILPYSVFRLKDSGPGYVEPLRFAPVRSSPARRRDKAYRWFSREPLSPALLVFTDDPGFEVVEKDEWLAPPLVPLPGGVEVREAVEAERLTITTSRPGHPLLVKISYHPRWKAEGADGPYLVSPALMMIVPRERTVRLVYSRNWADAAGFLLTLGAVGLTLGALGLRAWRGRSVRTLRNEAAVAVPLQAPAPSRRWGGWIPGTLLLVLFCARLVPSSAPDSALSDRLAEKASEAFSAERFDDAAEYAHGALSVAPGSPLRAELLCLRGESLLRGGRPRGAAEVFEAVVRDFPSGPYVPQALFGGAQAREAAGDRGLAAQHRQRLLDAFSDTPWAVRLRASGAASTPIQKTP